MRIQHSRPGVTAFAIIVATVVVGCVIGSRAAWAGIVAIASEGEVPPSAVATLRELTNTLDGLGMAAEPASIAIELGQAEPLPTVSDPSVTAKDLFAQIESGYRLWLRGDFAAAEAQLSAAMRAVGRNPGTVVADTAFRASLTRGLVGLALSRKRLKNIAGATEAMSELIRTLPEQPVTSAQFGPEADKFYQQIRRKLDAAPRGRLIVDVTRSDAQIFINEQGRAKGATFTTDVLPGLYRIMVQVAGESRRYIVVIKGNAETRLSLDWDASQYVRSTPGGLIVKLPLGKLSSANAVTRRFLQAAGLASGTYVVLQVATAAKATTIVGSVIGVDSMKVLRAARITLGDDNRQRAQHLAAYLATGEIDEDLEVVVEEKGSNRPTKVPEPVVPVPPVPAKPPVVVSPSVAPPSVGPPVLVSPSVVPRVSPPDATANSAAPVDKVPVTPARGPAHGRHAGYAWWAAGTGVLAVGGIVTGGYLLHLDGTATCSAGIAQCPDLYATAPAGYAVLAGGGALAIASGIFTYVWLSSGSRTVVVAMRPFGDGAMATVGGRF